MGQELATVCHWQGRSSPGKALLEGDHLLFRGEFRLCLRFADLRGIATTAGRLRLMVAEGLPPGGSSWFPSSCVPMRPLSASMRRT